MTSNHLLQREEVETGKRAVPEWIGKTPDTKVPRHVQARIFQAYGGVCYLSKRRIRAADKWDLDHIKALANGGENRESNLAPALRDKHREKTKVDRAEQTKTEHMRDKHLGLHKPKSSLSHPTLKRKMDGTVVPR